MLTPKASRKTPLKKPPSKPARDQPKDRAWGDCAFSSICDDAVVSVYSSLPRHWKLTMTATSATMKLIRSFI